MTKKSGNTITITRSSGASTLVPANADLTSKDNPPLGTNPKDLLGIKKLQLNLVPPASKAYQSLAMEDGNIKYGPYNFEDKTNHLYVNDTTADMIGTTAVTTRACEEPHKEFTSRTFVLHFVKREEHWQISMECIGTNCVR